MASYPFNWFAEDITHFFDPCIVQVFLVWDMVVRALGVFTASYHFVPKNHAFVVPPMMLDPWESFIIVGLTAFLHQII